MISEDDTENKSEKIFAPFSGTSFLCQPISTTGLPVVFHPIEPQAQPVNSAGESAAVDELPGSFGLSSS
jgi:hypothetical protein